MIVFSVFCERTNRFFYSLAYSSFLDEASLTRCSPFASTIICLRTAYWTAVCHGTRSLLHEIAPIQWPGDFWGRNYWWHRTYCGMCSGESLFFVLFSSIMLISVRRHLCFSTASTALFRRIFDVLSTRDVLKILTSWMTWDWALTMMRRFQGLTVAHRRILSRIQSCKFDIVNLMYCLKIKDYYCIDYLT